MWMNTTCQYFELLPKICLIFNRDLNIYLFYNFEQYLHSDVLATFAWFEKMVLIIANSCDL